MKQNKHFVLIRGLLRDARHWGVFVDCLQQQFPSARISTPDISGNGSRYQLTSPDTIAGMVADLRQQVKSEAPVILIGLSMGGMIASDWMVRYPDEIEASVLINTSIRSCSPFYQRLRWQIYPDLFKVIFHSTQVREADILRLTSNHYPEDTVLRQMWQQWQRQSPVSSRSARNQLLAAMKFALDSKPPHKILVLTSRGDRLVNYQCSLAIARHWAADCVVHPTAGHDLPLDQPVWLGETIKAWFS